MEIEGPMLQGDWDDGQQSTRSAYSNESPRTMGISAQKYVNRRENRRKSLTLATFLRFSDPQFQTKTSSRILGVSKPTESAIFLCGQNDNSSCKMGEPVDWTEGDWNCDVVFNQLDIVAAL